MHTRVHIYTHAYVHIHIYNRKFVFIFVFMFMHTRKRKVNVRFVKTQNTYLFTRKEGINMFGQQKWIILKYSAQAEKVSI